MISAGLCIMGGCFAQDETSRTVDSYWAAASIPVPYSASSLGIYEIQMLPPTPQSQLRVFTRQRVKSGTASLFFITQPSNTPYNFYGIVNERFSLQSNGSEPWLLSTNRVVEAGEIVEYAITGSRQECLTTGDWLEVQSWQEEGEIEKLRLLDARKGTKDFICCAGSVCIPFYVQACRSASGEVAVYDVEQKTLVEI